ncbi:MAG: immunoglobulin-like domain-containing protein [Bacteroidota bacterium]|jgi:uncharacterized protein YcfL
MKKTIIKSITALFITSVALVSCSKDETVPTITLKGDAIQVVLLNATATDPGVTANDDNDGDVTANVTSDYATVVNNKVAADYKVTYKVSDKAGNAATATRTVRVKIDASSVAAAYNVSESCTISGPGTYSSTIAQGTSATQITIGNFGNYGVNVTANISGDNGLTLTVPSVTIQGATFTGNGTIQNDGKKITISYTGTDSTDTENCTMTLTR